MPGQVDANILELLANPETHGMLEGQVVEVLWGTLGTVHPQESSTHNTVVEALTEPNTLGLLDHQITEVLWTDLTFEQQIEFNTVEVLWGTLGTPPAQQAGQHAQTVELLTFPPTLGMLEGSTVEVLTSLTVAVAAVSDIAGEPLVPLFFDGTTSTGFISHYRWNWVSVPGGSTIGNTKTTFPDFGATTPFNMTNNEVLYHAEEAAGVSGFDTSGNGNTATLTAITVGVPGQLGLRSWNFTGTTSKAQPATPVVIGTSWTIAYWFFNLAPNSAFRTGVRGSVSSHHIIVESGGDRLGAYVGGFRPTDTAFAMPVASYTGWHHLVAVGTAGGDTIFYVDGVKVGTVLGYRGSDPIHTIGNYQGNSQRFADRMDEIAIWSRELSTKEIRDIYFLQLGTFVAVGDTYPWTPDIEGTYTVNLTVVDGADNAQTVDTADAVIRERGGTGILSPFQGDPIRGWYHIQGNKFRRKK